MLNLYITSPNRKDGKTFLSAGIAATMQSLGYTTSVYKPVQTSSLDINGFRQSSDITFIKSIDPYINTHVSYLFKENSEPIIAAEEENSYIDIDFISSEYNKITVNSDCTILDGEGGILSPLAPNAQNLDMIKKLQIPTLMVIRPSDSTINNTLLSIYAAKDRGIELRGVVINNIEDNCPKEVLTSTTRIIEEYSGVNILGLIPNLGGKIIPEDLITGILNGVDIESIFKVKIEKLEF